ncbi:HAT, C-terminal dimerisation domain [Cinara cedri]|uniref:HAT, C-terminal dimerisation domain n=1 Tax=Cinara cedri TaxID=506608 RepID=A0A5E4M666_9HEMI|nr:HAT, C-terminal dimerisation domain [Cinara cedri]
MMKKLELWNLRLSKKNYDPFPKLNNFIESTEEELYNSINWIRQPFEIDTHQINGLTSFEEDSLVNIFTDSSLKIQFNQKSLENFWLHVRKDYPELSSKALEVLIPFPTTYSCEKAFSTLVDIKNKF